MYNNKKCRYQLTVVLPNKPLSNLEILDVARKISIPGFRGVFVRNRLPSKVNKNECGILNLDDSYGNGTHWVAWFKRGEEKYYSTVTAYSRPEN